MILTGTLFTSSGYSFMKSFGDAKWIIRPLGYKVRLLKGPVEKNEWTTDSDYAGFDVLTDRLV